MTPEIWLTVPHIKTYFGLFTFLLLFQDSSVLKGYKKIFYRFLILFSGLSSIYASVFASIFFLKLLLEKNKDNFLNFLCSLLPLIINIFIFLNLSNNASRFAFNFEKIESFSYNILIRPIFGSSIPKFCNCNTLTPETLIECFFKNVDAFWGVGFSFMLFK